MVVISDSHYYLLLSIKLKKDEEEDMYWWWSYFKANVIDQCTQRMMHFVTYCVDFFLFTSILSVTTDLSDSPLLLYFYHHDLPGTSFGKIFANSKIFLNVKSIFLLLPYRMDRSFSIPSSSINNLADRFFYMVWLLSKLNEFHFHFQ